MLDLYRFSQAVVDPLNVDGMLRFVIVALFVLGLHHANAQYVDGIGEFGVIKRNWAIIVQDECFGIVDKKGNIVLPPIYDAIDDFGDYSKKLCRLVYHGKEGFINNKGQVVLTP